MLSLLTPRYIIFLLATLSLFLWIVWSGRVSDFPTSLASAAQPEQEDTSLIINHKAVDPNRLCTPESFNDGQWVSSPALDPTNVTAEDVARVSKYSCKAGFHHKCYMRQGQELIRSAKMYVVPHIVQSFEEIV
jgi:hypothetical protein